MGEGEGGIVDAIYPAEQKNFGENKSGRGETNVMRITERQIKILNYRAKSRAT